MEESFPRGGALVSGGKRKSTKRHSEPDDLFKTSDSGLSATKKKKLNKLQQKQERLEKRKKQIKESVLQTQAPTPALLQRKNLSTGSLVLGCIKVIHDYELRVSLPNGQTGSVSITQVSDAYTERLQELTSVDPETSELDVSSLHDLFHCGQVVTAKILEIPRADKTSSKAGLIKLSLNPRDVNQSLTPSLLKQGMVLSCSVASVEDHGYILDLGVTSASSFVKNSEVKKYVEEYNQDKPLIVGSSLHCMVTSDVTASASGEESRLVKVTIDPRKVYRSHAKESMGLSLQTLLPGTLVEAKVTKVVDSGVNVSFLAFSGTIHSTHLQKRPGKFEVGDKLKAVIMYVHPTLKLVTLTQLVHLVTPDLAPRQHFGEIMIGDTISEAKIIRVDKDLGVTFLLKPGVHGLAKKHQLSDKEVKNVKDSFKKGSTHKCRVINFDYADNVVMVTLRESILNEKYLRYTDITPASIVEGKICAIHQFGISVKVTKQIQGYVPNIHLSDVPLRNPEKMFKVDDNLKCKVLDVDIEKSRLYLTHKKSLINTKLEDLVSYEQCTPGLISEGFVFKILPNGLVVKFYGKVQGFVPKGDLSTEFIEFPEKVFYPGQVVKCRVKNCDPQNRKLFLSLKMTGKVPFGVKSAEVPDDFQVGKLVNCRIKEKTDTGFDVVLLPSKIAAILPKMHLSDNHGNCEMLYHIHKKGDIIKDAMYLGKRNIVLLTKKQCLIKAYTEGTSINNFDELQPGMLLPAVVKKKMDYGIFVDLGHGLIGLAPNKYLSNKRLPEPAALFDVGQSVFAKVTEVEQEKKRFLVSLRMTDCYHGDLSDGLDLLTMHCVEYDDVLERMKQRKVLQKLSVFHVGQIINVTVTKVTERGVLCCHEDGVQGFITEDHLTGVAAEEGDVLQCVVLYLDPVQRCLELATNKGLVKAIRNLKDDKFSKAQEGQVIKSEVQLVKDSFVLVSLKAHAQGRLAYLPARKHLNDALEKHQFVIGQVNPVVIKKIHGDHILACLKIHEEESETQAVWQKASSLEKGTVLKAEITDILDLQMNIKVKDLQGRVHVSEVKDHPEKGENVLEDFKVGQEVKVKVIGLRKMESKKLRTKSRTLVECSMRPSKLAGTDVTKVSDVYSVGDTVQAYVTGMTKHYVWMCVGPHHQARVHVLDTGRTREVMKTDYKVGTCYPATVIGMEEGMLDLTLLDKPWELEAGKTTLGLVKQILPDGCLSVQLPNGHVGMVQTPDLSDSYMHAWPSSFKIDDCIKCYLLRRDDKRPNHWALSLRKSRLKKKGSKVVIKDPEISDISDLRAGMLVKGFMKSASHDGLVLSLGTDVTGNVSLKHLSRYFIKSIPSACPSGTVYTAKVLSIKDSTVELSLLEEDTGLPDCIPSTHRGSLRIQDDKQREAHEKWKARKRTLSDGEEDRPRCKKERGADDIGDDQGTTDDSGVDSVSDTSDNDSDMEVKSVPLVLKSPANAPRLSLATGFSWGLTPKAEKHTAEKNAESDSDSEDEIEEKPQRPKTKKEKMAEKKLDEQKLFERERLLMSGEKAPDCTSDFERLIMQSPDSSMVWLRYMAFHLETAEVEKARAVAERALKTISYREEQEKQNVWVAYLNLEHMYGTDESLNEVFTRALQHNEPIAVTKQLIQIHAKAGKIKAAEDLFSGLIRRYSMNKDVWTSFGSFYFTHDQLDAARKLMQRALKSLDKKDHVEVIAKFAQMEFKQGEPERGKTIFENLLSSYPRRTDLWSVYIDMVTRLGDLQPIRQLYERVINLKLSAKKMRFFFKKYLGFEEKHGDEDTVNAVKLKAVEYVEAKSQGAS